MCRLARIGGKFSDNLPIILINEAPAANGFLVEGVAASRAVNANRIDTAT